MHSERRISVWCNIEYRECSTFGHIYNLFNVQDFKNTIMCANHGSSWRNGLVISKNEHSVYKIVLFTSGALQLVNKLDGECFTSDDELALKTFTVYCALALHFSKQSRNMQMKVLICFDQ